MRSLAILGAIGVVALSACGDDEGGGGTPGTPDAGSDAASGGSGGGGGGSGGSTGGGGGSTASGGSAGSTGGSGGSSGGAGGSGGMPATDAGTGGTEPTDASSDGMSPDSSSAADAGMDAPQGDGCAPVLSCMDAGLPGPQEAYIKADIRNIEFGRSLAIEGNTLVVGAPYYDYEGNQDNRVLVFVRTCDGWEQQAVLAASNEDPSDLFGMAVAISGDTIVVGARQEGGDGSDPADDSLSDAGAAYVFTRCGGTWSQEAYLKPDVITDSDEFGTSVAIEGDTIVVGAPLEDSDATGVDGVDDNADARNSGAAYVFTRSATGWSQTAFLKASNTGLGDTFGESVAINGDAIVVGASNEDSAARGVNGDEGDDPSFSDSGAAYVFVRSGDSWAQQAYLKPSNTGANMSFGYAVSIDGDRLVIGAPVESGTSTGVNGSDEQLGFGNEGAAFVFARSGTTWAQEAYLKATNTERDNFGTSVAISGDLVVVGAPQEESAATGINGDDSDNTADGAGAAYTFTRSSGSWQPGPYPYVKASNTNQADVFGTAVAASGQLFAVSAIFEDSNALGVDGDQSNNDFINSGAVYVFRQ